MVRIASFNVENLFCAAQGIQYHQLVRWPASPERLSRGQHSDFKPPYSTAESTRKAIRGSLNIAGAARSVRAALLVDPSSVVPLSRKVGRGRLRAHPEYRVHAKR